MRIKSLGEVGITVRVSLVCPDGYRRGVIVEMELPYGCSRPRYESIGAGRSDTHAVLSHPDMGFVSVRGNVDRDGMWMRGSGADRDVCVTPHENE